MQLLSGSLWERKLKPKYKSIRKKNLQIMKKILYRIKRKITNIVEPRILSRSQRRRFMATLYYSYFNDSCHREHRAVIAGKINHLKESRETKNNYFLLTRNTHRIEKGLLMVPRRPVFARDYIGETIDSFEGIW